MKKIYVILFFIFLVFVFGFLCGLFTCNYKMSKIWEHNLISKFLPVESLRYVAIDMRGGFQSANSMTFALIKNDVDIAKLIEDIKSINPDYYKEDDVSFLVEKGEFSILISKRTRILTIHYVHL